MKGGRNSAIRIEKTDPPVTFVNSSNGRRSPSTPYGLMRHATVASTSTAVSRRQSSIQPLICSSSAIASMPLFVAITKLSLLCGEGSRCI